MVPAEPGLTNILHGSDGKRIVGISTESEDVNEGMVRFDIIFYVRVPSAECVTGKLSKIIIMIELGKEIPEHSELYEMHRLLGALLSQELTADEKLSIMGNG